MSTRSTHAVSRLALISSAGMYAACAVYDPSMLAVDDSSANVTHSVGGEANAGSGGAGSRAGGGAQAAEDHEAGGSSEPGSVAGSASSAGDVGLAGRASGDGGGAGSGGAGASPVGGSPGAQGGQANGGSANGGSAGSANAGSANAGSANVGSGGAAPTGVDPCLRKNWKASASKSSLSTDVPSLYDPPPQAIDGITTTRWSTGAVQTGGEWFIVDLGAVATHLTQIALDTGGHPADYPTSYELEASQDGASYSFVTSGSGSSQTTIKFSDKPARYLKITQTGSSSSWWSIHEVSISCQSN